MADRFYVAKEYRCGLCCALMLAYPRKSVPGSWRLEHPANHCQRAGCSYYLPAVDLEPLPKEFE